MENILDLQMPSYPIYKDKHAWYGNFIGGPLVAGYMISQNFKVFNEAHKARLTYAAVGLAIILQMMVAYFLPENNYIQIVITMFYSFVGQAVITHLQRDQIAQHLGSGGNTFKIGRVLIISVMGLVFMISIWTGIELLLAMKAKMYLLDDIH